jgi:hypothetical protein
MKESFTGLIFLTLTALIAWVFLPRTVHFSETLIIYPVEIVHCNKNGVCDVAQFFPTTKIRVDKMNRQVIWMSSADGMVGVWSDCSIIDKSNWTCSSPTMKMIDGKMESLQPELRYLSGWSYRLHWLGSLLPDLRQKD